MCVFIPQSQWRFASRLMPQQTKPCSYSAYLLEQPLVVWKNTAYSTGVKFSDNNI